MNTLGSMMKLRRMSSLQRSKPAEQAQGCGRRGKPGLESDVVLFKAAVVVGVGGAELGGLGLRHGQRPLVPLKETRPLICPLLNNSPLRE